jgi:uridine kinase
MAVLEKKVILSLEDLEEQLGSTKLHLFAQKAEDSFLKRTEQIAEYIASHRDIRAIFVSGPTSSGKTTFTDRLASHLLELGKTAYRMSLDDYYQIDILKYDEDGRPDYESLGMIDTSLVSEKIDRILSGEPTTMAQFDFSRRIRVAGDLLPTAHLKKDGLLLVEGLHGLSADISGIIPREKWVGIFIMPWGEVVADRRLIETQQVRLLRRIVRDSRHRGAHALATLDYWPMIVNSERHYFAEYLANADFYVNSMLSYESLVIAPLALQDIRTAMEAYRNNDLKPSVFMKNTLPPKSFADLPKAVLMAEQLLHDLPRIPEVSPHIVPADSILNEFL